MPAKQNGRKSLFSTSSITSIFLENNLFLRKFLTRYLRKDMDVEDVLQDTYLKVYHLEQKGTKIDKPKSFLFTVAKNLALNELNRQSRRISETIDDCLGEEAVEQLKHPSADNEIEAHQALGQYCEAIAQLPPKCRQVYLLRKVHGLSHKDIARRMGMSLDAVEKQLFRGMSRCRQYLESSVHQSSTQGNTVYNEVTALEKDFIRHG